MTTPPTNPPLPPPDRSGPAWTRNPKSSPKKHKSRPPPPGPGGAPYSNNAASSTSSISLLNPHASTSSLSLPQAQQPGEAPYLTHKHRYHGQLTLVAPDNLGARRQAGTVDAPETRIDARGGFGLPGMDEREGEDEGGAGRVEDDDERARKIKKKVKKKKKKEEEQARQRQIMQAVSNAGRTPSPTSNAPRQGQVATGANPGGPNEMARSSSGQAMLTVPTSGTQPRERRSRSRSRNRPTNEERSTNQRAQPTVATPSTRPTPSDSNPPPSRRTRPSRPTPAPPPRQPVTSHRRSLSPSYTAPPPIDDPNLDSQISLGLVDPSVLLSPPPPAYDPPPPIPSSSHPNEPPPPISVPSASSTSRRTVSASSTFDSEEEEEEEEDDSGPPDPLVLAWEEDRLTGLYSLDERISRDMERRRAAEEALLASQGSASTIGAIEEEETVEEEVPGQGEDDLNEIRQAEASRDSRRLSRALSRHASRRYGAGSRRSTLLFGSGLSQLRERRTTIEESEPSESQPPSVSHSPSPSPSPTPSPSIPVSIPLSPLPTLVEPSTQSTSATPRSPRPEQSASSLTIDDRNSPFPPPLMSPAESSAIAAEFPSPSPSQASPSLSNSPYISDSEDEVNPRASPSKALDMANPMILNDDMGVEREPAKEASEEAEEESEEEETEEQALARRVTRNGRGLAALAAERRLKMERDARDRAIGGTMIETVEEAEEGESPELKAGKLEGEVRAATPPPPQTIPIPQPAASHQPLPSPGPTPEEPRETPSARARKHSFNDAELSFSRPSSRSSFPRPAPPPQLVPLEPEPTTIASPSQRTVSSPLARPVPPPVPARRSVGRRSLDEPIPLPIAPASPSTLNRTSSGRRVPPPPPPPREIGQRPSVRALAAALNGTPILPRPSSPPTRSTATSIATTTRPDSLDSASVGSASTYPSSLSGPRPIPAPRLAQSMASNESLSGSVPRTASLPSSLEATSHLAPRRHRPLPIPPAPLSQDRIDAFTALRAVQGVLSPTSDAPSPAPVVPADPVPSTSASASASAPVRPILRPRLSSSSSSSSLEHPGPPLPRRPPQAQAEQLSAYTDLDVLLARLEGESASGAAQGTARTEEREPGEGEDGRNYDDLLTLGEIMGNVAPAGASPEEIAEHLTVAPVELERRRIDKRGKVKTKLSIVGVRCVDCSICMSRFRVDDSAVVLSNCLHIFHEKCIRSWFRRSRQCPVCRAQVFPPRPLVDLTAP